MSSRLPSQLDACAPSRTLGFPIRPVRPSDAPALVDLCRRVSAETRRLRFFDAERRLKPAEASALASVDQQHNHGLVAEATGIHADGRSGSNEVAAFGHLMELGCGNAAELSILVDDRYQGMGLGRRLLHRLLSTARRRNYTVIHAEFLSENTRIERLLESAGVPAIGEDWFGVTQMRLFLGRSELGADLTGQQRPRLIAA